MTDPAATLAALEAARVSLLGVVRAGDAVCWSDDELLAVTAAVEAVGRVIARTGPGAPARWPSDRASSWGLNGSRSGAGVARRASCSSG